MKIGIIILAAGESSRMGQPKQLLPYRGTTLIGQAVETACSVPAAPVVVVLGAHAALIGSHIGGEDVLVAENPDWKEGMGGSVRVGLAALTEAHPDASGAILMVCDQPKLSVPTLNLLITIHARTNCPVVASQYCGVLGVPALFARTVFPDLLALRGSEGAREIIRRHRLQLQSVPFSGGGLDVDTPADYANLIQRSNHQPLLTSV